MIKIAPKSHPSVKIAFYLEQADECGRIAASATLQNVRDRSLRSEAAWRKMAGDIDGASIVVPSSPEAASIPASTPSFASFA
ncbi:hypothetical protein [Aureimonas sp. Leaf454]|uniref:hypothetical protein n=1 Tax=Aureimonas sp. Leaf454 TaxID=1736381 RepID=UPI001AEC158E|nr:hypothetical protein [Aureimonas sp. Leaf454]